MNCEDRYLMKCGHADNAVTSDGRPACVMCGCIDIDREVHGTEGLDGRHAICLTCGKITESKWGLPFFKYDPGININGRTYDEYYCGCRGWD